MAFLETPSFPGCPNFGFTAIPQYSVTIASSASGRERRNRNWNRPRLRFECTVGPRVDDEIQQLLEFWHAVGGQEVGFRFKDYSDFKSSRVSDAVSSTDQPLEIVLDSPVSYQLSKAYSYGARTQLRPIYKPVQGTIVIADDGVLKSEGPDYSINYATGAVTISFTPIGDLTWGGEFEVPVRFDSDFPIEIVSREIQSVTFAMMEIRDPLVEV